MINVKVRSGLVLSFSGLAQLFYFCRRDRALSLRDVEEQTEISNPYLSQLENGQIKNPSFNVVKKLCTFYHLNISEL